MRAETLYPMLTLSFLLSLLLRVRKSLRNLVYFGICLIASRSGMLIPPYWMYLIFPCLYLTRPFCSLNYSLREREGYRLFLLNINMFKFSFFIIFSGVGSTIFPDLKSMTITLGTFELLLLGHVVGLILHPACD